MTHDADAVAYLPRARSLAIRHARRKGLPFDESVSAAFLGVAQAQCEYRDDRGASFATYAYHRVQSQLMDQQRQRMHEAGYVRYGEQMVRRASFVPLEPHIDVPTRDEITADAERTSMWRAILRADLSPRQRTAALHLQQGLSVAETALAMQVTPSAVIQLAHKIIVRVRRYYGWP